MANKDSAMISVIFALLFWVPWLNWIFCALAAVFGLRALYLIRRHPRQYGGKWYALAGSAVGVGVLILNIASVLLGF